MAKDPICGMDVNEKEASYKINPFELKDVINITGGQIQIIDVEETDIEIK